MDTFCWAIDEETKGLILGRGPAHLPPGRVERVLDVGCGTNEEIVDLCPDAREYLFLDSFALPAPTPRYTLLAQPIGARFPIADASLDVVTSNGSFDHFTQADRVHAFLEVERCLRPGGRFLFACEYFDFDPADEAAFFHTCATHPDALAINCPAYSTIDLRSILPGLTSLRILESRSALIPDGRPLRAFVSPAQARYYRSHVESLNVWWGAFFVVFEQR